MPKKNGSLQIINKEKALDLQDTGTLVHLGLLKSQNPFTSPRHFFLRHKPLQSNNWSGLEWNLGPYKHLR